MAIPIAPNTTCDIYRLGNSPPSTPDVEAVPVYLSSDYERRKEAGEDLDIGNRYTHVMLVGPTVDIRDGWTNFTTNSLNDTVYIPDKDGGLYYVNFVERRDRNLPTDHKRVYLHRDQADWDDLY